jgi:hypothetical protein
VPQGQSVGDQARRERRLGVLGWGERV